MEQQEGQPQGDIGAVAIRDQPRYPGNVDPRHNSLAAKNAGKGLKDPEVKVVPLASFMAMIGSEGEYVKAG